MLHKFIWCNELIYLHFILQRNLLVPLAIVPGKMKKAKQNIITNFIMFKARHM